MTPPPQSLYLRETMTVWGLLLCLIGIALVGHHFWLESRPVDEPAAPRPEKPAWYRQAGAHPRTSTPWPVIPPERPSLNDSTADPLSLREEQSEGEGVGDSHDEHGLDEEERTTSTASGPRESIESDKA